MKPTMELGILNREGMKALSQGNIGNAVFLLTQALDKSQAFKSRLNEAKVHNNLGLAAHLSHRHIKACAHFHHALRCVRQEIGEENSLYRTISTNLSKTLSTEELAA